MSCCLGSRTCGKRAFTAAVISAASSTLSVAVSYTHLTLPTTMTMSTSAESTFTASWRFWVA